MRHGQFTWYFSDPDAMSWMGLRRWRAGPMSGRRSPHDAWRSAATEESLLCRSSSGGSTPRAHPPTPAWPAPAKYDYWHYKQDLQPRETYDHAYQPWWPAAAFSSALRPTIRLSASTPRRASLVGRSSPKDPCGLSPTIVGDQTVGRIGRWVRVLPVATADGRVAVEDARRAAGQPLHRQRSRHLPLARAVGCVGARRHRVLCRGDVPAERRRVSGRPRRGHRSMRRCGSRSNSPCRDTCCSPTSNCCFPPAARLRASMIDATGKLLGGIVQSWRGLHRRHARSGGRGTR